MEFAVLQIVSNSKEVQVMELFHFPNVYFNAKSWKQLNGNLLYIMQTLNRTKNQFL